MKATRFSTALLLTLLFALVATAQQTTTTTSTSTSAQGDLVVLASAWHKEVARPGRKTNPFQANEEYISQTRAEKAYIRNRDYSLPSPTEPRFPTVTPKPLGPDTAPYDIYVYRIAVQNYGTKKIRAFNWEYQFFHPDTNELMGSRRILTKVPIAPGQKTVIEVRLKQRPANIVFVDQLDKKLRDQFKEQVIIHKIHYKDRTVWTRTP